MFQTKPQIAIDLVDRALRNGVRVAYWTCDELYGRDGAFLDALDTRNQAFVAEIPNDMRVWTKPPQVVHHATRKRPGRPKQTPYVAAVPARCEVRSLLKHSSRFHQQTWQRYLIKETNKGPEVWEVKHLTVWRNTSAGLPSNRQTLIVTRSLRTGEIKYFLSNRVVGENGVTLRGLLRVAFGRWAIEACFRLAKEELGLDHFEVRSWHCIHRHFFVTGLSFLLCSRIRQDLDPGRTQELTVEQVRRSLNTWLQHHDLPPPLRDEKFQQELDQQRYYQHRNAQAQRSHTQTRRELYKQLGVHVDQIKTCIPIDES